MNEKIMFLNGLLVFLWFLISGSVSLTWSSSINSMFSTRSVMPTADGLKSNLLDTIASGAQMAMNECKNTFKWDRWNCPESAFSRKHNQPTTRESGFATAILAAGIVHSIARNCSRGDLPGCGCENKQGKPFNTTHFNKIDLPPHPDEDEDERKPKNSDWTWGGCSESTKYAEQVARNFLNSLERGSDPQAYANLHNHLVGRALVRSTMVRHCRCHGLSGSCSLQTCWMQLAPFPEVANALRERYNKAVQIPLHNDDRSISSLENTLETISKKKDDTLVYLDDSPNYCKADFHSGWHGTKGRMCSRNHTSSSIPERRSCKKLCKTCGHKVRRKETKITYRCNCEFHWCCQVTCSICTKVVDEYFCE